MLYAPSGNYGEREMHGMSCPAIFTHCRTNCLAILKSFRRDCRGWSYGLLGLSQQPWSPRKTKKNNRKSAPPASNTTDDIMNAQNTIITVLKFTFLYLNDPTFFNFRLNNMMMLWNLTVLLLNIKRHGESDDMGMASEIWTSCCHWISMIALIQKYNLISILKMTENICHSRLTSEEVPNVKYSFL